MAYQVIARKYRPQRFRDVVGQEHVTQTLAQAIERKRIAHAYLFCGPRGTGKTTIARIFAKCLNCTDGPRVDFGDEDPRCREIAEGRSLDVLEIDAASNRGIDEIRGLRETVRYAPASSKFKIYIIDEVHMLTKEAFNALLKTLEEPPEHVKFMFATTEPEKVLTTILSRCQRFDLRRIPTTLIVKHLAHIAAQENVRIHPAALHAIARGAEGAMRDAESTLDQLISFCGESVEEADVLSMFGLASQEQLLALAGAMLEGQAQETLRQLHALVESGKDLARLLSDLLNHFRNLLIHVISRGDPQLLEVSEAEAASLASQARLATPDGLTRILEILGDTEMRLRDAASKKILIEVALLKGIEARNAVSLDSVLTRLQELRDEGGGTSAGTGSGTPPAAGVPQPGTAQAPRTVTAPKRATPAVASVTAEARAASSASGEAKEAAVAEPRQAAAVMGPLGQPGGTDLAVIWDQLLEVVGRASPFTRTYLLEAHPVSLTGKWFTIGFPAKFEDHIALVDNAKNQALLQSTLAELGHPGMKVKFVKAEPPVSASSASKAPEPSVTKVEQKVPTAAASSAPAGPGSGVKSAVGSAASGKDKPVTVPFSPEDFKNDPLIQKAVELFKGRIVDVRAQAN